MCLEVIEGSVADQAGLQGTTETRTLDVGFEVAVPGDIIVAIDGDAVDSVEDVSHKVIYGSATGDQLELSIIRDGTEIGVIVTLQVPSADDPQSTAG